MSTALELVYQYRHLLGKCDAGTGLSMEEIEALQTIEAVFSADDPIAETDLWACQREFDRWEVELDAELRGSRFSDKVRVANLGPGGMVLLRAPYVEQGQTVEVVIDDDELSLSYRFKAVVIWLRDDDDDDFSVGLELVGSPVLVRYGSSSDTGEHNRAETEKIEDEGNRVAA
jgi:hypothetical protein